MTCLILVTTIGLTLSAIGSLVLILPNFSKTRNVDDDFILNMDKDGNYTQKKHIKNRQVNIVGFTLLLLGFLLQIIGLIIPVFNP